MGKLSRTIVLVGIVLLLAITNPGLTELNNWLKNQVAKQISAEVGPQDAALITTFGLDKLAVGFINNNIDRKDFILFTLYRVTIPEGIKTKQFYGNLYVIGIAKNFIIIPNRLLGE